MLVEEGRQPLDGPRRRFGVRIQQEKVGARGFRSGAIHARGKSHVLIQAYEPGAGEALDHEIAAPVS
jgi:hypothetical protein